MDAEEEKMKGILMGNHDQVGLNIPGGKACGRLCPLPVSYEAP
jgi:hypothetical protein